MEEGNERKQLLDGFQTIDGDESLNDLHTKHVKVEAGKYFDSTEGNLAYMLNNDRRISSA